MTLLEFLQTEGAVGGLTILEEVSELVGMNGGMTLKPWGQHFEGGPYGRMGLTIEEAIRLNFLSGVIEGFVRAHDGTGMTELKMLIKEQIQKDAQARRTPPLVGADGNPITEENKK